MDQQKMDVICRRLPPFPPLATRLIDMFSREDADLYAAEQLIRSDAVFSGELIRIANSAEFANFEPFEEVNQAIMYLGFERVRTAVRRITYARLMKDTFKSPFTAEIHRSNMATAFLTERLMKAFGEPEDLEDSCPYSLGLYLKIGALAMLRAFPSEYPRFVSVSVTNAEQFVLNEKKRFGFDHAAISMNLIRHWEFPENFQALVLQHTEPPQPSEHLTAQNACRISWRLAGTLGFTFLRGIPFPPFSEYQQYLPAGHPEFPASEQEWKDAIAAHLRDIEVPQ